MRIVAWNCGGAFHRKWDAIAALKPDVAVISECCQPERLTDLGHSSAEWVGRHHYKGLGVFTFGDWKIEAMAQDDTLEWMLPLKLSGPADLELYAIWAMNHRSSTHSQETPGYRQAQTLIDRHAIGQRDVPTVIIGDFNDSPVFEGSRFAELTERFDSLGFPSLYHRQTGEAFGEESSPTLWWRDRTQDGPKYHIDYAFVSADLAARSQISVGSYETWVTEAGSDHAALVVDIDI